MLLDKALKLLRGLLIVFTGPDIGFVESSLNFKTNLGLPKLCFALKSLSAKVAEHTHTPHKELWLCLGRTEASAKT